MQMLQNLLLIVHADHEQAGDIGLREVHAHLLECGAVCVRLCAARKDHDARDAKAARAGWQRIGQRVAVGRVGACEDANWSVGAVLRECKRSHRQRLGPIKDWRSGRLEAFETDRTVRLRGGVDKFLTPAGECSRTTARQA